MAMAVYALTNKTEKEHYRANEQQFYYWWKLPRCASLGAHHILLHQKECAKTPRKRHTKSSFNYKKPFQLQIL